MDLSIKILIVDDSVAMRRVLKRELKELGFTDIIEANNGFTALEKLKDNHFDLIISDWNMPKIKGIDFLKKVRSSDGVSPEFKDIPFILLTAEGQKQNIIDAFRAGVSEYITKPFTADDISEKLNKIFN